MASYIPTETNKSDPEQDVPRRKIGYVKDSLIDTNSRPKQSGDTEEPEQIYTDWASI